MTFEHSSSSSASPLTALTPTHLATICSSPGFQILRKFLANSPYEICAQHATCSPSDLSTWLLHRDILHAIITPVVHFYTRASQLASAALCSRKYEELELAFRGDARSAFIWLQCFIHEEEDWCYTRGCPACTTLHSVSTESTIRATLAAALLSSVAPGSESTASDAGPSLPDCSSILPAYKHALHNDAFWGPGHYSTILARAQRLTAGIQDLISQCGVLEGLVSSVPPSATSGLELRRGHTIDVVVPDQDQKSREIKLKKGRMARRQARLRDEQQHMITRIAWQCWFAASMPADQRLALKAASRKGEIVGRRRTLTCP
ncbi:hypothetical protein FKW77_000655 [Venturia effusa]|uniref:Uncharacterized protein n=1 Tax=Venturia effusa TaxID=50376 RepID=A0A517L4R4_9PEZI|nr:hypothetical protein FKW77_000655 [Venturia effusa]